MVKLSVSIISSSQVFSTPTRNIVSILLSICKIQPLFIWYFPKFKISGPTQVLHDWIDCLDSLPLSDDAYFCFDQHAWYCKLAGGEHGQKPKSGIDVRDTFSIEQIRNHFQEKISEPIK